MDISSSVNQEILMVASENISLAFLLERGLDCVRRGSYIEGAAFLVLARERLTPEQMQWAVLIDAFLQSQSNWWLAQQSLHLANKQVIKTDSERKNCLLELEKLLFSLYGETKISEAYQPQQLRQPPHLNSTGSNRSNDAEGKPSSPRLPPKDSKALPDLYISCFGHFEVRRFDQIVDLCRNRSGQAILRYLIAQPDYSASADALLGVFWAEDSPEVARRKLQIAVSAARHALNSGYSCDPGGGYIICKNQYYLINSTVTIHTDVDEFLSLWKAGQQASASQATILYESACQLYTGPFIVEDMYADWSFSRRDQLHQIYLAMCHALAKYYSETNHYEEARKWTGAILKEDHCDEEAHRQLICIYSAEGRRSEALRQFQRCERILAEELGVSPMPETMQLLQTLLTGKPLPNE